MNDQIQEFIASDIDIVSAFDKACDVHRTKIGFLIGLLHHIQQHFIIAVICECYTLCYALGKVAQMIDETIISDGIFIDLFVKVVSNDIENFLDDLRRLLDLVGTDTVLCFRVDQMQRNEAGFIVVESDPRFLFDDIDPLKADFVFIRIEPRDIK